MLLQACVNGARSPGEHPALPMRPEELALDARRVRDAGAEAVHLHVKDDLGKDTFDASSTDAALSAVRRAAPDLPVGVTTGAWALPDPADRVAAIRSWRSVPDFASVNWHEEGAELVAAALLERGIAVEAGLWHADAVAAWLTSPLRGECLRVLIELPDGLDDSQTIDEADSLLEMVGDAVVVLHGEGSSCWPALEHAGRRGLATRIGLEDTLTLPDGSIAADNVGLLLAARKLLGLA